MDETTRGPLPGGLILTHTHLAKNNCYLHLLVLKETLSSRG